MSGKEEVATGISSSTILSARMPRSSIRRADATGHSEPQKRLAKSLVATSVFRDGQCANRNQSSISRAVSAAFSASIEKWFASIVRTACDGSNGVARQ